MTLENLIRNDIKIFIEEQRDLFFNENDMQMNLAVYLMRSSKNYSDVSIEYYMPSEQLDGYLWEKELYIDIVVRKDNEYVAIELKYPTSKISEPLERFGEQLTKDHVTLLKEHSAHNLVQYRFWKDVRRLELLKKRFPSVKKGFAILLTNDLSYMKPHKKGTNCEPFSTNKGLHGTIMHWANDKGEKMKKKGYPDFMLDNHYAINWHKICLNNHEFIYCIIEV